MNILSFLITELLDNKWLNIVFDDNNRGVFLTIPKENLKEKIKAFVLE